jgi:hypothetical protein
VMDVNEPAPVVISGAREISDGKNIF